jgi:hypothetical protein
MPKQHTFKSTQSTDWIDSILDSYKGVNKSNFIRHLVIQGLIQMGHQPPDPYAQYKTIASPSVSPVTQLESQKVTHVTQNEPQKEAPAVEPIGAATTPPELDEPPIIELQTVEIDFDAALRDMNDNFS